MGRLVYPRFSESERDETTILALPARFDLLPARRPDRQKGKPSYARFPASGTTAGREERGGRKATPRFDAGQGLPVGIRLQNGDAQVAGSLRGVLPQREG